MYRNEKQVFSASAGFTLIELMIVVAVVGILASIASVNYEKHQRKSRQSEAKLALAGIYSLEKSFYGEYAAYIPSFDAIGYTPEGNKRFYYAQACSSGTYAGNITGYVGSKGTSGIWYANIPFTPTFSFTAGHTCGTGKSMS